MVVFEGSAVLPTTPERAFAIVGDPANEARIFPMITRYEPEGGVMREGGTNHMRGRVLGLPLRMQSVTRVWDPPRRIVREGTKPAGPVRMTLTQTFQPHPEGTLATYRADITGPRPAAAVFRWFIARNFRGSVPRLLALLREPSSHV